MYCPICGIYVPIYEPEHACPPESDGAQQGFVRGWSMNSPIYRAKSFVSSIKFIAKYLLSQNILTTSTIILGEDPTEWKYFYYKKES